MVDPISPIARDDGLASTCEDTTVALTRKHGFDTAWYCERVAHDSLLVGYRSGAISRFSDKMLLHRGCGLAGLIFASQAIHWVDDYLESSKISHDYDERIAAESLHRILGAPVWADGAFCGVLMVGSREGATFGSGALNLVETVARDLSDALTATVLRQRLAALEAQTRETAARLRALETHATASRGKIRDRERDVLDRVALGQTNREIALAMQLSECTVKSYLRNAMRRLGARNRTEAVAYARINGYL